MSPFEEWLAQEVSPKLRAIERWNSYRKPGLDLEPLAEVIRAAIKPYHFWQTERASSVKPLPPVTHSAGGTAPEGLHTVMEAYSLKHMGNKIIPTRRLGAQFRECCSAMERLGYRKMSAPNGAGTMDYWFEA